MMDTNTIIYNIYIHTSIPHSVLYILLDLFENTFMTFLESCQLLQAQIKPASYRVSLGELNNILVDYKYFT